MDPHENTKNTENDQTSKIEPARVCQVCGGPNHHGCGCEARKLKALKQKQALNALPKIHIYEGGTEYPLCGNPDTEGDKFTTNEYEVTCNGCQVLLTPKSGPGPYAEQEEELLKEILANPLVIEARQLSLDQAKNIEMIASRFEDLVFYAKSIDATLKVIAGEVITIRKDLVEVKEETEDPDQPKTK